MRSPDMLDAVIIGGGACGLMCAVQAGQRGKRTLVLERNSRAGAKILISGGGRCNYTNLNTSTANFVSEFPDFSASVLAQWTVSDTVSFFETQGIAGQEKTLGQLFPTTNKAKDVVAVFERLLARYHQDIWMDALAMAVRQASDGTFEVDVEHRGRSITVATRTVVVASGGLPVAKLGASDFGLRLARQFGLRIVQHAPALVPLTITGKNADWFAALSGNSVFSRVTCNGVSFEENILFTHWGLSGPAILQISSYWRAGESLTIDLLPRFSMDSLIKAERNAGGKRLVAQLLNDHFSKRLVDALGKFLPTDTKIASLSKLDAKKVADTIHRFVVKPAGDKGYDKAEVMRGGVATDELDRDSLQAEKVPGLFFGGECVDMTGWLGGYNFQWAWASGFAIAQRI